MADQRVGRSTDAVATAVGLVAGGLALAPLITAVLALTAGVVRQELSSFDDGGGRELTLFGMIGQFDGLESATGVVPLVVIVVLALVVQLIAAATVLVTTRSESAGPPLLPVVLMVTGVVVVLTTMVLIPVLDSADDVDNPQPAVDRPYGLTGPGWAHLMLAGVTAIAAGSLIRSVRGWLD